MGGARRGFRLVTFGGEAAVIAHVDLPAPRVGKYGVAVALIDRFAAGLRARDPRGIYLIDEIGKMECLSAAFVEAVTDLLAGGRPLVATVAERGVGLIDEVKRRSDVEVWTVTPATRDGLPDRVVAWIHGAQRVWYDRSTASPFPPSRLPLVSSGAREPDCERRDGEV